MRKTIALLSSLIVIAGLAATMVSAEAGPPKKGKNVAKLADPGFAYFDTDGAGGKPGTFFLSGTGRRFPFKVASTWNGSYTGSDSARHLGLQKNGAWPKAPANCGTFGLAHWAPELVQISTGRYVMYFSACYDKKGDGIGARNCVNRAVSTKPGGYYRTVGSPICAPGKSSEAIDASGFVRNGQRWMLFKTNRPIGKQKAKYNIWAVAMQPDGVTRKPGSKWVHVIGSNTLLEAPKVVVRGKYLHLFVARNAYANCSYSTDVFRSTQLAGGWSRRTLLTTKSVSRCGPGGASVAHDGRQHYIAFHAWDSYQGNKAKNAKRSTYVARLLWTKDNWPYVPNN